METIQETEIANEKPTSENSSNVKLALTEILLVFTSVIGLMWVFEIIPGFESWQQAVLGKAVLEAAIYMALPGLLLIYLLGDDDEAAVFNKNSLNEALRIGGKSMSVMLPATLGFPLASMLGYGYTDWGGAVILSGCYLLATIAVLWLLKNEETTTDLTFSTKDAIRAAYVFLAGLATVTIMHHVNEMARNVIISLVFIGFLEEFFFRGYMQPRLNIAFGKPFEFLNLKFGWGLIITALLFGLIHVISPGDNPMEWSWGFWTFISGLGFGVIREKAGTFVAPALVHGVTMIFPLIFA